MRKILASAVSLCILLLLIISPALPAFAAQGEQTVRYGRTTITDSNVEYAYDVIASELMKPTPNFDIELDADRHITQEQLLRAYYLFKSDYPECFWIGLSYSLYSSGTDIVMFKLQPVFSSSELPEAKAALEDEIDTIMNGMPSTDNYDKALYLHDALLRKVTYRQTGHHQTAYGALVSNVAVCAGYAAAYQLLLQRAGIQAWTVTGESAINGKPPVAHAWNVVWIEDGICVYTDTTWNDDDSEIFHYYFNLSKSDMENDHTVSEDIFTLPPCTHEDRSYFDINNHTIKSSSSVQDVARLFGPAQNKKRHATLIYEDGDIDDLDLWISNNKTALWEALNCNPYEPSSISLSQKGGEIHITIEGDFPEMTYAVNVNAHSSLITYDSNVQYVKIGSSMQSITYTAKKGFYFPDDYPVESKNGVSVTRTDSKTLTVSGTPTQNTTFSLPQATAMEKEATPTAVFTPTEEGSGILSGITTGMKYSIDGSTWIEIAANNDITVSGITSSKIYVVKCGNGESTLDSDVQTINVPNPLAASNGGQSEAPPSNSGSSDNLNDGTVNTPTKPLFGCSMSATGTLVIIATVSTVATCGFIKRKKDN